VAKDVLLWAAILAKRTCTPMPWFLSLPLVEFAAIIDDLVD
jgi:hypothetical protein